MMSQVIVNSSNNTNNNNENQNNNTGGRTFVFRFSWGLIIAFALAIAFAVGGGFIGYFAGVSLESTLATSATNNILSGEIMKQFGYSNTSTALHVVGIQNLNVALSLPSELTFAGAMIGGVLGFLLGLLYEKHQGKDRNIFE